MKCSNELIFKNTFNQSCPFLLIILRDAFERKRILKTALAYSSDKESELTCPGGDPQTFYSDNFSYTSFFQELQTPPFLTNKKILILEMFENLNEEDLKKILTYLEKPNPWIQLILTASQLPSQSKILKKIEKEGVVFAIPEEKPWEKENRLIAWLMSAARESGTEISQEAAKMLVSAPGIDLNNELEKLICFTYGKKSVSPKDVLEISSITIQGNLWQLADAIFLKQKQLSRTIANSLMEENTDIFLILNSLRSQIQTAIQSLSLFHESGKASVTKVFPFLKGGLLDKKLKLFENYGLNNLKKSFFIIYQTEAKMKDSSSNPKILFDILLSKLI